jgi:demethylmenaquinone methyltransferase/2-methoxy-6-polyprenyl-1,4-benzoquinol methylase
MFDGIARRYDLLNRVMSFGVDRWWRKRTVDALALAPDARILDLATGTADVALAVLARRPDVSVVGLDPSESMLAIGRRKSTRRGVDARLELRVGVAEELPFGDATFDGACMAFGIRNVPDRPRALAEIARVVKPRGRVAILELSEPRRGLLGPITRFHIHTVVPRLGALLSGAREYRYLHRSIAAFPPPAEFASMLDDAGIDVLRVAPLTFGACHLYVGAVRGTT